MSGDEIQEKLRDRYLRGDDFSREVLELIHSLGVAICNKNLRILQLEDAIKTAEVKGDGRS